MTQTHAQKMDEARDQLNAVARALRLEANRLGLSSAAQVELAAHLVDDALRALQAPSRGDARGPVPLDWHDA